MTWSVSISAKNKRSSCKDTLTDVSIKATEQHAANQHHHLALPEASDESGALERHIASTVMFIRTQTRILERDTAW